MSAPIFSTDLTKSVIELDRNLKIKTGSVLQIFDKEYPQIIDKQTTDLRTDKMMRYEGNGAAPEKTEGDSAALTSLRESHVDQGTQTTYAHDMPITWEVRMFAVKNAKIVNQMGEYQGRSGILRYEFTSAAVINNGTSTSFLGGDGKPYFAADHFFKVNPGVTYSNLLSAAALSKTSLQNDLIVIAQAKMENDIPGMLKAMKVHIGTENIFAIAEILKSTLDPETANNTYNAIQDVGLVKNLNHYFTDTNSYVIDTQVKTRTLLEAAAPQISSYIDPKNRNLVEQLILSIGTVFHDYIGSYFNAGS